MDHEPSLLAPAIQEVMDKALVPMFGENLPLYYAAVERHQGDARELIDRARRVTQELISAALDRLTFFGEDRATFLGEAHEHTTDLSQMTASWEIRAGFGPVSVRSRPQSSIFSPP